MVVSRFAIRAGFLPNQVVRFSTGTLVARVRNGAGGLLATPTLGALYRTRCLALRGNRVLASFAVGASGLSSVALCLAAFARHAGTHRTGTLRADGAVGACELCAGAIRPRAAGTCFAGEVFHVTVFTDLALDAFVASC